jgi:protoporphyrin/coproporphyrin ferrochelatase
MNQKKTAVLLINLGTPDSPETKDVRPYLSEFLNDPRVIDIPWLLRKILVNLIIVPFRAPKSAKIYKELWDDRGSSLLYHTEDLTRKIQKELEGQMDVFFAMRYKNPSMDKVLEEIRLKNYDKIIAVPLFPQYSSAANGSAMEKFMKIVSQWHVIPEIALVSQFYNHPKFIEAFVERGSQYNIDDYDFVMFSYHGLPERQVDKVYNDKISCKDHHCEKEIDHDNKFCYKATCYETTRLIAKQLNIPESKYVVSFQSRLDNKWLEPFSDKVIEQKAKEGAKKVLVFSPAFVADCLETTIEIGEEYQEIFEEHGGVKVQLVPSLNTSDKWVEALKAIILERS